jgi:hypothetical protein
MAKFAIRLASTAVMVGAVLLKAHPSAAQAPDGFLRMGTAYPVSVRLPSQTQLEPAIYGEYATYDITHEPRRRLFVDARAGMRIHRQLAAAVSVSVTGSPTNTAVSGLVPSPLIRGHDRRASPFRTVPHHRQIDLHLQAVYFLAATSRVDLSLSGGPTIFRVSRDAVSDVRVGTETLPFETVSLAGVDTMRLQKTGVGAHFGVDLGVMVGRVVGVGFFGRYVMGSVNTRAGGARTINVGGLQVGGGLRFRL